jgi:hypothetical protein
MDQQISPLRAQLGDALAYAVNAPLEYNSVEACLRARRPIEPSDPARDVQCGLKADF